MPTVGDSRRRRAVTGTTAVVITVVLFCALALSVGVTTAQSPGEENDTGEQGPIPSLSGWNDSLDWLSENTPESGADGVEEYSVLSWWDYGNAIGEDGERAEVANFSQKNTRPVAEALLAQTEREALNALSEEFDARPRYVMVDALMAETATTPGGKFFALPDALGDANPSAFYRTMVADDEILATIHTQAYYESLLTRLYRYHGSSKAPEPVVVNWQGRVQETDDGGGVVVAPQNRDDTVRFETNLTAARETVANDPSSQVGGIGPHPEERVPALEQFRLVHLDEVSLLPERFGGNVTATQNALDSGLPRWSLSNTVGRELPLLDSTVGDELQNQREQLAFLYETTPSYTKTFERVPGATIEGTLNESASVDELTLLVELDPEDGRNFTYSQVVDVENSEFTATVPYATTGYDEWGVEEGYTDTSIRATGPYRAFASGGFDRNTSELVTYQGAVNVTEAQVIGENPCQSTVEVTERRQEFNFGEEDDTDGDESGEQAPGEESTGTIVTDCPERTNDDGSDDDKMNRGDDEASGGDDETNDGGDSTDGEGDGETRDGGTESSGDGSGPGFGVGGALAGLAGAGYLLRRRLSS
jgi:PGF-CTERM protein